MSAIAPLSPTIADPAEQHMIGIVDIFATEALRAQDKEQMIVAGFNASGTLKHWLMLDGVSDKILFDIDYLGSVLADPDCHYLAIAHNHPSGNPHPSRADLRTTRHLADLCNETGVKLVEHIIVGSTENHHIFCQHSG